MGEQRVSDERVTGWITALEGDGYGIVEREDALALALDLRDARAECERLRDRVCELEGIDRIDADGIEEFTSRALAAEAESDALRARCEALAAALRPFVLMAHEGGQAITGAQIEAARAALARHREETTT